MLEGKRKEGRTPRPTVALARAAACSQTERLLLLADPYLADPALLDLVQQRLVTHAEHLRGLPAVPPHLIQRAFDRGALGFHRGGSGDVGERPTLLGGGRGRHRVLDEVGLEGRRRFDPRRSGHRREAAVRCQRESRPGGGILMKRASGELPQFADDELLVLENDEPLHHVLELADVARPLVREEELSQLARHRRGRAVVLPRVPGDEEVGEVWNFVPPLSKRAEL